jgi:hypothetical protein
MCIPFDYMPIQTFIRTRKLQKHKAGCKLTCSVYLLADLLRGVGDTAGKTVGGLTDTLGNTVGNAGKNVGDATPGGETINNTTGKVGDSTKTVGKTAQDPIGSVGGQKQTANNPLGLSK